MSRRRPSTSWIESRRPWPETPCVSALVMISRPQAFEIALEQFRGALVELALEQAVRSARARSPRIPSWCSAYAGLQAEQAAPGDGGASGPVALGEVAHADRVVGLPQDARAGQAEALDRRDERARAHRQDQLVVGQAPRAELDVAVDAVDLRPRFPHQQAGLEYRLPSRSSGAGTVRGAFTAIITFLLGFPTALFIAGQERRRRNLLLLLITDPVPHQRLLARIYAWMVLLRTGGVFDTVAQSLGFSRASLGLLYTPFATEIGPIHSNLPYMILPIYASLEKLDRRLIEASHTSARAILLTTRWIVLPLALPGIVGGFVLVFIPSLGSFIAPESPRRRRQDDDAVEL